MYGQKTNIGNLSRHPTLRGHQMKYLVACIVLAAAARPAWADSITVTSAKAAGYYITAMGDVLDEEFRQHQISSFD